MNVSEFPMVRVLLSGVFLAASLFGCSSRGVVPLALDRQQIASLSRVVKFAAATPAPTMRDRRKATSAKHRFDQVYQGGDSSNDVCVGNCVIDGQRLSLDFGDAWQAAAPQGATSVEFVVDQPPASSGAVVSFSAPNSTAPYTESLILDSSNGHGPGMFAYDYYAVWTMADGSTLQTDKLFSSFQVACSLARGECPFGVITDSASGLKVDEHSRPGSVVVASGQEIPLTASVTNVGSYSFQIQSSSDTAWAIPGNVLKNYDIADGIAVNLGDLDTVGNNVDFYMLRDTDDNNGTPISFSTIATRNDGNETAYVYGNAQYLAQVPVAQGYDTESTPAYGSKLVPTSFALGQETIDSTTNHFGYNYEFSIITPSASGGEFGILKNIYSTISWAPDRSTYSHGTNGQTMLYQCQFPQAPVQAPAGSSLLVTGGNTFGLHIGLAAVGKITAASREDYIDNTLLFKATATSGRESIWVPVTAIGLHWGASASVDSTGLTWSPLQAPGGNGGPFAYESYSADRTYEPTWSAVFTEPFNGPAIASQSPSPCASTS